DQAETRIGTAIVAELLGVGEVLVRIDDRRIVVVFVISVEPGEEDVHRILVLAEEGLTIHRREIPLLGMGRRGEGEGGGNGSQGDASEHQAWSFPCQTTDDRRRRTGSQSASRRPSSVLCPPSSDYSKTPAEAGVRQ